MKNYSLFNFFNHRTPLVSWPQTNELISAESLADVKKVMADRLSNPSVKEAIYVASEGLYESIYLRANDIAQALKDDGLAKSAYKYLSRMGTRPTPFGYFSGPGMGNWTKGKSEILIPSDEKLNRHVSLDYAYVFGIIQALLEEEPSIKRYLTLHPNSTLSLITERSRFVTYKYNKRALVYGINSVAKTDYLIDVLSRATGGAKLDDLTESLLKYDVSKEDAEEYILSLIDNQILITELEPVLSAGFSFDRLNSMVSRIHQESGGKLLREVKAECERIKKNIDAIMARVPENPEQAYSEIRFKEIEPAVKPGFYFQNVLTKATEGAKLNFKIASKIRKAADALNKLTIPVLDNHINTFRDNFVKKYENARVPLLEALDSEIGIGYQASNTVRDDTPLIDGLTFDRSSDNLRSRFNWNKAHSLLLTKVLDARSKNSKVVNISKEELAKLPSNWHNVPDTLAIVAKLEALPEDESQEMLTVNSGGYATALAPFNRFTFLGEDFLQAGNEIISIEEELAQDCILAELTHVPDYLRIGNILQRGTERSYEIPFLTVSSKDKDSVIYLDDLYLCVRDNRLILLSKSHEKRVRILLSQAHNYRLKTHPLYHFLGDLQLQGFNWPIVCDWGGLERIYKFMPRVMYDDIQLKPATWSMVKADYDLLLKNPNDDEVLDVFREKWGVPDKIQITVADNMLLIDFRNPLSRMVFFDELKKGENLTFVEFAEPSLQSAPRNLQNEQFCNELISFFYRNDAPNLIKPRPGEWNDEKADVKSIFYPGEKWAYFKLYAGAKNVDRLVVELLEPLTKSAQSKGLIDKWFFIRYGDPDWHLRLRLSLVDQSRYGELVDLVRETTMEFISSKIVNQFQIDTYVREIDRYGAATIEDTETYFHYDSAITVGVLKNILESEDAEKIRYQYLIIATHQILEDFEVSLEDRIALLNIMDATTQFNIADKLNRKYRNMSGEISDLLEKKTEDSYAKFLIQTLSQRSQLTKPIIQKIKGQLTIDPGGYISSIIHMTINRICLVRANHQEYVVYNFLTRYYMSRVARMKYNSKK